MKKLFIFLYGLALTAAIAAAAVFSGLNYYQTDNITVDITDNIAKALIADSTDLSDADLDYLVTLVNDASEEDVNTLPETGVKTSTSVKVLPSAVKYPKAIECKVYQYDGNSLSYLSTYKCNPVPPLVRTSVIATTTARPTANPSMYGPFINDGSSKSPINPPLKSVNMALYKSNTTVSCFVGSKVVKTEYYSEEFIKGRMLIKKVTYEICIKSVSFGPN